MLTWDNPEKKFYETGLSHGILYVHTGSILFPATPTGVAWEGLMGVKETPGGSEKTSLWVNNREYAQLISPKTFSGVLEAYSYPNEFEVCLGKTEPGLGIYFDNQFKRRFSLCYRTLINDDNSSGPMGYKIHFVYNLLATSKEVSWKSLSPTIEAVPFSWDVSSLPVPATCGELPERRPVHSVVVDSRRCSSAFLTALEDRLLAGDFLSPCDLMDLYDEYFDPGRFLTFPRHQSGESSTILNVSDNNGWDWTERSHPSYDVRTAVITNTGRIIILGGDTGTDQLAFSDDNGDTWMGEESGIELPSSCVWSSIRQIQNGRIIAISQSGIGARSAISDDNGNNWAGRSLPSGLWLDFVQLSSGRLVGVGGNSTSSIVSNDNGETWNFQSVLPSSLTLSSITVGQNDRLIAVARDGSGNRVVISDDEGDTWFSVPSINNENSWRKVITLSNGYLFAVAANGTNRGMLSTDNGSNWVSVNIPEFAWRSVVEGLPELDGSPGRLVAVASSGSDDFRIGVSDDFGLTWTTRPATEQAGWTLVIYSPADPFA
jgi:hypothetical protein